MMQPQKDQRPAISPDSLCPYITFLFLHCTTHNPADACRRLIDFMKRPRNRGPHIKSTIVALGFHHVDHLLRTRTATAGIDQLDGFIYRLESRPSWAAPGTEYTDVRYLLALIVRRDNLFAIYCDPSLREAISRWVGNPGVSPFRRIRREVIQGAFVRGEAKGLWLRGAHARSTIRPDSKNLTGQRLQDVLNPLEDSSFGLTAARIELPDDITRSALLGTVGSTPRKGVIWNRPTENFTEFCKAATEAMVLIEETLSEGTPLDRPFPILATESQSLEGVHGAYDILSRAPDDLLTPAGTSAEMLEAADLLQRATLNVVGSRDTPHFVLEVGLDNTISGRVRGVVKEYGDSVSFKFGFEGEPTDLPPARRILDALKYEDLIMVYYDSGHVVSTHGIWSRNIREAPFPNWQFLDFSDFDITKEKPAEIPAEIHSRVGSAEDKSLFGWVTRHFSSGWLICDDGPGEIADFLHIGPDGVLRLVHVKAVKTGAIERGIAVSPYEVVASQAAKNSRYSDPDLLYERLVAPSTRPSAVWIDGRRVDDRSEFLDMLKCLQPTDQKRVVIVQPHVSELAYRRIRGAGATAGSELFRLNSLETLLHTARGAIISLGADLYVIGSRR